MNKPNKGAASSIGMKAVALLALLIAGGMARAAAEEVEATILFEPKQPGDLYSLSTNPNSKIADKRMGIGYSNVGSAVHTLPNYLVKGSKIVYDNEGMKNQMGEAIQPKRLIAIITEDGTYIELTELVSMYDIAWYFDYLYDKLVREGRAR